jgi:branched-chain amino acid transport system permease protein
MLFLQLLAQGIITGSFYALAGVSWGIIYRTTLTFHFAHHLVFAVSGFAAALATTDLGFHYLLGLGMSIFFAALVGSLIDALLYKTLRKAGASKATTFLASLGLATAGVAVLLLIFSSTPRSVKGFPIKTLSLGPVFFTTADVAMVLASTAATGLVFLFLGKSRYGKVIRAVGSNRDMAFNVGINIDHVYVLVYSIGSALFGLAGFLFTVKNAAYPTMGLHPFFISFTAVFLGGVPSILGHALAGFLLGLAENIGMIVLPGEYKLMIAYGILFIVILVRPEGLIGRRRG